MYNKSIFIFRRSLRIFDNTGLNEALLLSKSVIPIFIFTPEQVLKNSYKSNNAFQFMIESLNDLNTALKKHNSKLFFFFGKQDLVIASLIKNHTIDAIFVNTDYTPYAQKRDKAIARICKKHNVVFHRDEDVLLNPINSIQSGSKKPYLKYTPYFFKAIKNPVTKPHKTIKNNFCGKNTKLKGIFTGSPERFYNKNNAIKIHGGRTNGLKILKKIKKFKNYDKQRNNLMYQTTLLSAHLKFGTISIREAFHAFKNAGSKDLIRQLYWRDFYYNIAYHFPHVFKTAMKEKLKKFRWTNKKIWFEKWTQGKTGFPIVDACMNELNKTGFMHNRGRLIVSSFLTKILLLDWRKGEKYFAQKLIDYDPCVNNGNWQWSASTGVDSQPYFRIFNPWLQSKKYDPDATYIKTWLPELTDIPAQDLHRWDKKHKEYEGDYPPPMVDYEKARQKALATFKK